MHSVELKKVACLGRKLKLSSQKIQNNLDCMAIRVVPNRGTEFLIFSKVQTHFGSPVYFRVWVTNSPGYDQRIIFMTQPSRSGTDFDFLTWIFASLVLMTHSLVDVQ